MALNIDQEIVMNEVRLTAADTTAEFYRGLLAADALTGPMKSEVTCVLTDLDEKLAQLKAANAKLIPSAFKLPQDSSPDRDAKEVIRQCLLLRIVLHDLMVRLNTLGERVL